MRVKADGPFGPVTMDALNRSHQKILFDEIKEDRKGYIKMLGATETGQAINVQKWLQRMDEFLFVSVDSPT